jgi:hypothetical protein
MGNNKKGGKKNKSISLVGKHRPSAIKRLMNPLVTLRGGVHLDKKRQHDKLKCRGKANDDE